MRTQSLLGGLSFLAIAAFTGGCSKHVGFVGTWQTTQINQGGALATMTFNPDQTMSFVSTNGPKGVPYKLTGVGTWSFKANKLTVTPVSMQLDGLPRTTRAKIMPFIKSQLDVPQSGPVQWKGSDEFVCTKNGIDQHFKRIK